MTGSSGLRRTQGRVPDAFGRALMQWERGGTDPEVIERADGVSDFGAGHELYLSERRNWPSPERRALRYVRGRVVDVGCGAGRVALELQRRGLEVVGVDASPLAIRTARSRGVKAAWCMSIDSLGKRISSFDTVVLYGNNFGIFGTRERLQRVLTDWAQAMPDGARILAESTSPYGGGVPALDRRTQERNRQRGLLPGTTRLRVRYQGMVGAWFDWLFVSPREMRTVLRGTGWNQRTVLGGLSSEPYVAILEKA